MWSLSESVSRFAPLVKKKKHPFKKSKQLKVKVMSKWLEVCQLDQVLPDSGVCALVNEKQVAIFRLGEGEELYAVDNHDPFSKANVLSRGLVGDIKGEIVVASPVYKQHFVLNSGKCLEDESVQLETYPVKVVNGAVQVQA